MKRKKPANNRSIIHHTFSLTQQEYDAIHLLMDENGSTSMGEWVRRKTRSFLDTVTFLEDYPDAEVLLLHRYEAPEEGGYTFPLKTLFQKHKAGEREIQIVFDQSLYERLEAYDAYSIDDLLYSACLFAWRVHVMTYDFIALRSGETILMLRSILQMRSD